MMRSLAAAFIRRRLLLASLALVGVVLTAVPADLAAQDPFSKVATQGALITRNVINIAGFIFIIGGALALYTGHGGVVGPLFAIVVPLVIMLNADYWVQFLRF